MSRHKHYPLRNAHVARGIRAQGLRIFSIHAGWLRSWLMALEDMKLGARLGRGRQYAQSGQVTELTVDGSRVRATVVGSRDEPYSVGIDFAAARGAALRRIRARLAAEPMLLARLLAIDLPQELEEIFAVEGLPLSPTLDTVKCTCSCPDWGKPCKHVAAVLFLLGEEIARRPSLLCVLRGVDPDDFLPAPAAVSRPQAPAAPPPAFDNDPEAAAGLVTRLGAIPFWRGLGKCVDSLSRALRRTSPVAAAAADGKSIDLRA